MNHSLRLHHQHHQAHVMLLVPCQTDVALSVSDKFSPKCLLDSGAIAAKDRNPAAAIGVRTNIHNQVLHGHSSPWSTFDVSLHCAPAAAESCCGCSCYKASDYMAAPAERLALSPLKATSSTGETVAVINIGGLLPKASTKYEVCWQHELLQQRGCWP
jgi:hypothetical protein